MVCSHAGLPGWLALAKFIGFVELLTSFKDTVDDKTRLVRFSESPIMSTYLVAIVVGEFEASETKTKDNITVRCLTPMGKVEQGRFALEASKRALEYYTEFFNVPYPLPKVIWKKFNYQNLKFSILFDII